MKKNILAGLSILIPFAVTAWIIRALFHRFTTPFIDWIKPLLLTLHLHPGKAWLTFLAHVIILGLLLTFTCIIGYISSLSFMSRWIDRWHALILRIPLLRLVYEPIHSLLKLITDPNKRIFEEPKVMRLEEINAYTLGLRTISEPLAHIESHLGHDTQVILLPGVPNPLIGFVLFVKKAAHNSVKMSVEETVKFMVSCGLLHPKARD